LTSPVLACYFAHVSRHRLFFVQIALCCGLLCLALMLQLWARSVLTAQAEALGAAQWPVTLAHMASALCAVSALLGIGLALSDRLRRAPAAQQTSVRRSQVTPATQRAYRPERRQAIWRQRPLDDDDAWRRALMRSLLDPAIGLALLGGALLLTQVLIAIGIFRLARLRRAALDANADTALNTRVIDTAARIQDERTAEGLTARLIADALNRPVTLRPGLLVADVEPAPYFSVTDREGVRYFLCSAPQLFRQLRIVRRSDPSRNVSALSIGTRAEVLAIWEALTRLRGFTHVAMPRGADWHVIAFDPRREPVSLFTRLRTLLTARKLARAERQMQPVEPAPDLAPEQPLPGRLLDIPAEPRHTQPAAVLSEVAA
jgi:hypothetical protein